MEDQVMETAPNNQVSNNVKNNNIFYKEIETCIQNRPVNDVNKIKRKNPFPYVRNIKSYTQNKSQRTIYGDEVVIDLYNLRTKKLYNKNEF
jgi:hypothetical protein